jgi:hypothetical protein
LAAPDWLEKGVGRGVGGDRPRKSPSFENKAVQNGIVEIAGPERAQFNEIVARWWPAI